MFQIAEPARVALGSAIEQRGVFESAFALDTLLGSTVLGASEPIVAQIRLAWWRDQIGKQRDETSSNDPLLNHIFDAWGTDAHSLIALVDGWEALLADPKNLSEFVHGRASLAGSIASRLNQQKEAKAAELNGKWWAYADLASRLDDVEIREWAVSHARQILKKPGRTSPQLRPLAVLGGLARRSLKHGGTPMIGDRLSPFVALRLGMFGI